MNNAASADHKFQAPGILEPMHHLTLRALPVEVVELLDGLSLVAIDAVATSECLPWIIWNVENDGWYTSELLERLATGFRAVHEKTGKRGAALIREIIRYLGTIRILDEDEQKTIPATVTT